MTPLLTLPQEMFFVILAFILFAALVGDFRNARFFRSIRNRPSPWKDLARDLKVLFFLLAACMAWAQNKMLMPGGGGESMTTVTPESMEGTGDWLSGSSLETTGGGSYSMTGEGGWEAAGITWALRMALPPFTTNAVLTESQYLGGFACVSVTNIQPSVLNAPSNAVVYTNWPYAVARHSVPLPQGSLPAGFQFGGRAVTNLYVSASGMLSFDSPKSSPTPATNGIPDGTAVNYISVLQTPSDIVPTNGLFWYAPGTNSSLFTWKDVFLGQDTNCLATVQAELYASGDFTCRYYFPSLTNNYAQLTNAFLIGAQNSSGGETVLYTNALLSIHPSFLPAFELQWKSLIDLGPNVSDYDADGLSDADELFIYRSDPRNSDSDGDALMDGEEISSYGTDPNAFSSDASGQGDLWRILGGLDPSDAPYTFATPSESVGILTITTRLTNAPSGGGAVLRIGNQYIPVLSGTTLVSRIALPRDASIFFILARGVNCDNAIAHITVEASSFTKIRDPSGALSGSFTLSPSSVNASGTLIMPAYTITPDVVCFHSPTSSVLRIESADPDIYFNVGQGRVREYTPTKPENLPAGFTIGAITGSLACAGSFFTVTGTEFSHPAHFCNGTSWEEDPYDDEDWYCHTDIFGHTVGYPPYMESSCPCIALYDNAYDCLCSGRGEYPCPCAHPVCDPYITPADEPHDGPPYKETREHVRLEIGKDTSHFPVTVPQGEYEPCPRCRCAMGRALSAYVFRQTGNINVTPLSLYTNGSFAVTGIQPSTNFAAEVLTVHLKDTYIQQSYTVLGTSVYPADTGHSVSNWFVGCNITNALTLWTGVKLPSDTGEVTLSVTVDSGTPAPQLYVYNRIAQSNELLVSQENITYTQNLGDWRDTYCDTNGYAQAWLLCANSGVGRVAHSYATYSGQSYELSASSNQLFTAVGPHLVPDYDRDGKILEADCNLAKEGEAFRLWINDDKDVGDEDAAGGTDIPSQSSDPNCQDIAVNGRRDLLDFFPVLIDVGDFERLCGEPDSYRIKQADTAVNIVFTSLDENSSGSYLTEDITGCGPGLQDALASTAILNVGDEGYTLTPAFMTRLRQASGKGVFLVEGVRASSAPLVLEAVKGGQVIFSAELPMYVQPVEELYERVNLRDGEAVVTPSTWEGVRSLFQKNVIFLHGFNVDEQQARAAHAEMFKRLWQSGSNARFYGVTWRGDYGYEPGFHYQDNVNFAFQAAIHLKNYVTDNISGDTTILAHSLGNMVVSSAINDHGMSVGKYFMFNSAIAAEAFDDSQWNTDPVENVMVPTDWFDYPSNTWCSTWHQLFTTSDDRNKLKWSGRFTNVLSRTSLYNYYSSGDEVLELFTEAPNATTGVGYILETVERYSWHKQETHKGTGALDPAGTAWAGWGFGNPFYIDLEIPYVHFYYPDAAAAALAPSSQLMDIPVFKKTPDEMFASPITYLLQAEILARGIPALSGPTGGRLTRISMTDNDERNINMNMFARPNDWPRSVNNEPYGQRWKHGDWKDVAYFYNFKVYEDVVTKGGLK